MYKSEGSDSIDASKIVMAEPIKYTTYDTYDDKADDYTYIHFRYDLIYFWERVHFLDAVISLLFVFDEASIT